MWYGIIKHRNLTITQFYRDSSFTYSGHTTFRAKFWGCNMTVPIDEQIQNPSDSRLINEYSALCVHRMLSTVFSTAHSWTSFWARWDQSTPSHIRYYFFQSQSTSKSRKWLFTSGGFLNENFVCGRLPYVWDMSRPSHLFWTTEQIIKLLLCTTLHSPVKSSPLCSNTCILLFPNTS